MFPRKSFVFSLVVFGLSSASAFQGAVTGATAESGRAALDVTDTPFLNPAGVAFLRGYHFASAYSSGSLVPEVRQKEYSFSLTDNTEETVLATSLGFNEVVRFYEGDRRDIRKDFQLSFGFEAFENISVGLRLGYQDDYYLERYRQTKASLGGMWLVNPALTLAAVFDGLTPTDSQLPAQIRQRPQTHFGVSYLYERMIRMRGDLSSDSSNTLARPTVAAGVESFLTQWVIVRVGTQYNAELERSLYSGGMGFQGPRFSANYAYISESLNNETRHAVDLNIPIW